MKTTYFESKEYEENGFGNGFEGFSSGSGDGSGFGNGEGRGSVYGYGSIVALNPFIAWHSCNIVSRHGAYIHAGYDITHPETDIALNAGEHIVPCEWGLHACQEECIPNHARGLNAAITKVVCSGVVVFEKDKLVCEHREVVEIVQYGLEV
jgi:hypothetical protein